MLLASKLYADHADLLILSKLQLQRHVTHVLPTGFKSMRSSVGGLSSECKCSEGIHDQIHP
jgi:hypothetical protein